MTLLRRKFIYNGNGRCNNTLYSTQPCKSLQRLNRAYRTLHQHWIEKNWAGINPCHRQWNRTYIKCNHNICNININLEHPCSVDKWTS